MPFSQSIGKALGKMTIVRKILAAAAVAGAISVLPISVIANDIQSVGGVAGGTTIGSTTNGGQGSWPFKP